MRTKISLMVTVILCMMVLMTVFAGAATTTGMEDGIWAATSEALGDGENPPTFRINVIVTDGKVDNIDFWYYAGTHKYQRAFLAYAQTEEAKAEMTAILDELEYYAEELAKTNDAVKVSKFSKPAQYAETGKEYGAYEQLQKLWKDVVAQAGGKISQDSVSSANVSAVGNPKTGDISAVIYVVIAGAALVGMILLGRKKFTA